MKIASTSFCTQNCKCHVRAKILFMFLLIYGRKNKQDTFLGEVPLMFSNRDKFESRRGDFDVRFPTILT